MKTTLALLALFILVLGGGYWWSQHTTEQAAQPAGAITAGASEATSTAVHGAASYTLAQVATHNTASSCWAAISGNVYDLTSWISQHPGGEARILSICGKDGTSSFMGQHGRDPQAESILATFKIGTLAR